MSLRCPAAAAPTYKSSVLPRWCDQRCTSDRITGSRRNLVPQYRPGTRTDHGVRGRRRIATSSLARHPFTLAAMPQHASRARRQKAVGPEFERQPTVPATTLLDSTARASALAVHPLDCAWLLLVLSAESSPPDCLGTRTVITWARRHRWSTVDPTKVNGRPTNGSHEAEPVSLSPDLAYQHWSFQLPGLPGWRPRAGTSPRPAERLHQSMLRLLRRFVPR